MALLIPLILLIVLKDAFGVERTFYLMGTYAVVDMPSEEEVYKAYKDLKRVESLISSYIKDSDTNRVNAHAGIRPVRVSKEFLELLKTSVEISRRTKGYFDVTVGALTINHLRKGILSREEALKLVNFRDIEISDGSVFLKKKGMALDFGGIGKGFAIEAAYRSLSSDRGFIGIAGDIKVWNQEIPLAVKDPIRGGSLLQMVNARDLCLSTSGNYHKKHISKKDKDLVQITVVYDNCTYADAYATALFAMPREERAFFFRENPSVGVLELYRDGSLYMNEAFRSYFKVIILRSGKRVPSESQ